MASTPTKRLKDLSKGGYARVGLALALAPDPEVLLLDEPTSGLDLLTRREFLASLVELAAARPDDPHLQPLDRRTGEGLHPRRPAPRRQDDPLLDARGTAEEGAPAQPAVRGQPPDAAGLGTVLERNGTGRFWQVLVQDPDPAAVAALQSSPACRDFEDVPVTLEEVYAALMARSANGMGTSAIPLVKLADRRGVVTRLASGRKK